MIIELKEEQAGAELFSPARLENKTKLSPARASLLGLGLAKKVMK
jgi:hypothetical protein